MTASFLGGFLLVAANLLTLLEPPTHSNQAHAEPMLLAQESGLTLVDFPYEITDDFDLSEVATVAYADQQVEVDMTAPFIPIYTDGKRIEGGRVHLIDIHGNTIALDILHSAQQDRITFSHENSLRADLLQYLYTNDMPDDLWFEANEYIRNHPNYNLLLTIYRTLPPRQSQNSTAEYERYYSLGSELFWDLFEEFFDTDLNNL